MLNPGHIGPDKLYQWLEWEKDLWFTGEMWSFVWALEIALPSSLGLIPILSMVVACKGDQPCLIHTWSWSYEESDSCNQTTAGSSNLKFFQYVWMRQCSSHCHASLQILNSLKCFREFRKKPMSNLQWLFLFANAKSVQSSCKWRNYFCCIPVLKKNWLIVQFTSQFCWKYHFL